MYRFIIIVAVLICFAGSAEAECEIDKPSWWRPDHYTCAIVIRLYCPIPRSEQQSLEGYIKMYEHDDAGYDDYMGGETFSGASYSSWYRNGTITRPIWVIGRAEDGKFGGNVEPYLTIKHNCGGSINVTTYKPENDGLYLRRNTYLGTLDLKLNKIRDI